jgi:transposase
VITIGVDAHKRVHVALALDEAGRELDHWRGPNAAGWLDFLRWASASGPERWVGIEGA